MSGEYQKVEIGNGTFYIGDCFDVMRDLPDGSVDMVITSPPYDDMRTYNGSLNDWCHETFVAISDHLISTIKSGGVLVWNVGDATINGSETGSSFRQVISMMDRGLLLADTMIWEKTGAGALGSNRIYGQNFEYMFVLSKGKHSVFNPINDRENVIKSGKVSTNGGLVEGKGKTRVVERKPFGKRTNIWRINPKQKSFHPAPFPIELVEDHIVSWSDAGHTILDPFGGSGTTAIAAENAGRRWICIEREPEYAGKAIERIRAHIGEQQTVSIETFEHLFD